MQNSLICKYKKGVYRFFSTDKYLFLSYAMDDRKRSECLRHIQEQDRSDHVEKVGGCT